MTICLLICSGLAIDALAPDWLPDALREWANTNRWAPLLLVLAVLPIALGLPGGLSPLTSRYTAFLWPAFLAAIALVLGLVTYLEQAGPEAPLIAPLFWTLALFVGSVEVFWGPGTALVEPPLALELARLAALSASLFTAVEIALKLSSQHLSRLRLMVDRKRIVVIGLSPETVSVLQAIARTMPPDALLVVLDDVGDEAATAEAVALGAVVLPGPITTPASRHCRIATACLLRTMGGSRIILASQIIVLHRRMKDAIEAARMVETTLSGASLEPGSICRLMVRIDDPWTAASWRRERASHDKPWITDAISAYEQTARALVDLSGCPQGTPLVVVGRSRLALSVLAEVAHVRRVALLTSDGDAGDDPTGTVVIVGPDTPELAADLHLFQRRFGTPTAPPVEVTTAASPHGRVSLAEIESVLGAYPTAAVVLALPPGEGDPEMAARVAAAYPLTTVFSWEADATEVPSTPTVGRVYRIGLSLNDLDDKPPRDNWSRLGELVHEHFRSVSDPPTKPRAVHGAWDDLPVFYRESNVRQLGVILGAVAEPSIDRTWSAPPATVPLPWTDAEIDTLAQAEHESWCAYYRAHGWRHKAAPADEEPRAADWRLDYDARLRSPYLVSWAELGSAGQDKNRDYVRWALDLLPLLGCIATPAMHEYLRVGTITASRLDKAREWIGKGHVLYAEAGDWWVEDEHGHGRSVKPESFSRSHRWIGDHTYERTGTVMARRAIPGETIASLEGPTVAAEGDLVVSSGGQSWIVGRAAFEAGYRPAGAPSGQNLP